MPVFLFVADNEQQVPAGYAQRVLVSTTQAQNYIDPQDNRQKGPMHMAFALMRQAQVPLVPNLTYKPTLISIESKFGDMPLIIQCAAPALSQVQVNAPYAEPHGNRGQDQIPLPVVGDKTRWAPAGDLEPLPDAALSGGGDGLFNEMDGLAGTYTDTYANGVEVTRPRDLRIPQSVPNQQRTG